MKTLLFVALVLVGCAPKSVDLAPATPSALVHPAAPNSEVASFTYSAIRTAGDPDWLKDQAVGGRCSVLLSEGTNLETPCPALVIVAEDGKGKEKGRASVVEGKFRVSVPKGSQYYLRIETQGYEVEGKKRVGPFATGDVLLLKVRKRP